MTTPLETQVLHRPLELKQQQKFLLYAMPVAFFVGGTAFPLSVLVYWATWNLWIMGEQTLLIRDDPTPGNPKGEPDA